MTIRYEVGDATDPPNKNRAAILHVCNNKGAWGSGFVLALSKRWTRPEQKYREVPTSRLALGQIQLVAVDDDMFVVNMIAQDGFATPERPRAINYAALAVCLDKVKQNFDGYSIHMPRIGAGLGGGDWNIIEQIVDDAIGDFDVTVWDLP